LQSLLLPSGYPSITAGVAVMMFSQSDILLTLKHAAFHH
jgi:hypothetical protein